MSICIVDTSILCEILEIPSKCGSFEEIAANLARKVQDREWLLLPQTAVLETGNHIGQIGNGHQRREAAQRFIQFVHDALHGKNPFVPTPFAESGVWLEWLEEFPGWAWQGSGWGDLTILKEFHRQCGLNPHRRVYIWSLDGHLSSYRREP